MPTLPRLATLTLLMAGAAHAELYQWTDSHGKTHFSDQAPSHTKARSLPTPEPARTGSLQPSRPATDTPAGAPARNRADTQPSCDSARQDLQYWLDRRPYTVNQQTGEPEFTGDPRYETYISDARQRVRKRCAP